MKIQEFIEQLRGTDEYISLIYTKGGCYKFALLLQAMYGGDLWWNIIDHVVLRNEGRFYDITGEVIGAGYIPMSMFPSSFHKVAKKWSFSARHLFVGECPACGAELYTNGHEVTI